MCWRVCERICHGVTEDWNEWESEEHECEGNECEGSYLRWIGRLMPC